MNDKFPTCADVVREIWGERWSTTVPMTPDERVAFNDDVAVIRRDRELIIEACRRMTTEWNRYDQSAGDEDWALLTERWLE